MKYRTTTESNIVAATHDELTLASEGVLLPIGATGFLMSLLMLAALLS